MTHRHRRITEDIARAIAAHATQFEQQAQSASNTIQGQNDFAAGAKELT